MAVRGMTGRGTVTATIGPGVAHDAAGNLNRPSTSSDNSVVYELPMFVCEDGDACYTSWRKKCPRAERCTRTPTDAAICTVESVWRDAFACSAVSEGFQEGTALVGLAATNPTCCFHGSPDAEGHAVPVRRVIP